MACNEVVEIRLQKSNETGALNTWHDSGVDPIVEGSSRDYKIVGGLLFGAEITRESARRCRWLLFHGPKIQPSRS